jgi:hypothetical protein
MMVGVRTRMLAYALGIIDIDALVVVSSTKIEGYLNLHSTSVFIFPSIKGSHPA